MKNQSPRSSQDINLNVTTSEKPLIDELTNLEDSELKTDERGIFKAELAKGSIDITNTPYQNNNQVGTAKVEPLPDALFNNLIPKMNYQVKSMNNFEN